MRCYSLREISRAQMKLLQNELCSHERRRLRQFNGLIPALAVDFRHQVVRAFRLGKVLFPFTIRLVDLTPGWGEEDYGCVSVFPAGILNDPDIAQTNQTRIAQSIWDTAVRKQRFWCGCM